jgi:hypothetical protein
MDIKELKNRPEIDRHEKLNASFNQFDKLLKELRAKELPNETVKSINSEIDQVNSASESDNDLSKQIKSAQSHIIKIIEKKHKLVTKNHYRNTWLAIGMAAFGIPLGVSFGISFGNMAFLGVGLPIGMAMGMAIGTDMDKKAFEEGRQIDLEIKH